MSVIAAYEDGPNVTIGADSQVTSNVIHETCKLIKVGDSCVGVTGSLVLNTFVHDYAEPLVTASDVRRFALAIFKWAKDGGTGMTGDALNGGMLVASPRGLFRVFNDGSALQIPAGTPMAIGSGGEFALAAMHCGRNVLGAVAMAIDLDPYCGLPVELRTVEVMGG